jgi:hypothetical protein
MADTTRRINHGSEAATSGCAPLLSLSLSLSYLSIGPAQVSWNVAPRKEFSSLLTVKTLTGMTTDVYPREKLHSRSLEDDREDLHFSADGRPAP